MKRVVAAVFDVVAVVILGYLGFRLTLAVIPCRNLGDCPPLGPLTALLVLVAVAIYFAVGYALWHCTLGERLALGPRRP
ncbi:MAG TPA: hypothetical protein VFB58_16170 [Chloroflexota bacterium]|nr:hypothetical protein [Chloroflexota bacterium]